MTPSPSSRRPAATHGSLSARQRQDFAWAARTARKEGVKLVVHGVTVSRDNLPPPANESGQPGQQRRRQAETTAPSHGASGAQQPAEIPGAPAGAATETSSPGAEGVQQMETTSTARAAAQPRGSSARRAAGRSTSSGCASRTSGQLSPSWSPVPPARSTAATHLRPGCARG